MMDKDKERQIRNLFEFIADDIGFNRIVTRKSPGLFRYVGGMKTTMDLDGRDLESFTVNFNDQTISWSASQTSYHNGSSYDTKVASEPWVQLETCMSSLVEATHRQIVRQQDDADREAVRARRQIVVDRIMNKERE